MRSRARAAVAACCLAFGCAVAPSQRTGPVDDGRYVMGTILEISLEGVAARDGEEILEELFALAARLDHLMTRFDSSSQLSRLNRAAGQGPQTVDPDLALLLRRSVAYTRLTRGSFDVTVGPLVELWIDAAVAGAPPSPSERARARQRVDAAAIRFHPDGRVELARAGVAIDLGGIAKGYALDRMRPLLRSRGVEIALLDFGQSSTLALGAPAGAAGWRLLARGPGEELLGVVTLRDQALSISSSFGQWLAIGDRRYGHIIDPRSGEPLTRPREALIVSPDATLAEALSKALLILPADEGLELVSAQGGCEGMLVDAAGGVRTTPGWARATRWEPAAPAAD